MRLGKVGWSAVGLAAAIWVVVIAATASWRHNEFLSHRYDLGNMVQAIWSTTQGRPLEMTDGTTGDQIVRLGAHVDPILLLFAPIWWVVPRPEALIVAYVAVLASGVYPVVRLAMKQTRSRRAAVLLGCWYLVLPWTVWIAFNELNPVSLALPLLLFAFWFLDEDRLGWFALFAVLAVATGELIGLSVAAMGVWRALSRRDFRLGGGIAAAGVVWTAVCLAVIVPYYSDGESSRYYTRFERVGGSPLGLLETALTDPVTVVSEMTTRSDITYLAWLVLPTALVALGAPLLLFVLALPQMSMILLAGDPQPEIPVHHWSAPVVAALVVATIIAVARLPVRLRPAVAAAVLVMAGALLVVVAPRPGTDSYLFVEREAHDRVAAMKQAIALVPRDSPVTVTNRLGAHLSARRIVHLFPARGEADWAVLDTRDPSNTASWIGPVTFDVGLARLESGSGWRLVFDREGIRVYRRDRS